MTFFYMLIVLGFVGICYIAWECRNAMPEPAVGVGTLPEPEPLTGLLTVWRGQHIEDMRFMTGPVPPLRLPSTPDVCPICHCPLLRQRPRQLHGALEVPPGWAAHTSPRRDRTSGHPAPPLTRPTDTRTGPHRSTHHGT